MKAALAAYSLLGADAGVAALVGGRIYPVELPQAHTLPALVYRVVSVPRPLLLNGSEGCVEARVQVTAHAATYLAAKTLQAAVQAAADGYTGTPGGVTVEACQVDDGPDLHDPQSQTEQAVSDLLLTYQE